MNSEMIRIWNSEVSAEDTVYILGDVAFCKAAKAVVFLTQLNGHKILIEGNHDASNLDHQAFRDCFDKIYKYHEIKLNGTKICLFHYPIKEWNLCHHGSIMLHGHLHGNPSGLEQYRCRDVGFDATGKVVSLLEDVVADAMLGEIKYHGFKQ